MVAFAHRSVERSVFRKLRFSKVKSGLRRRWFSFAVRRFPTRPFAGSLVDAGTHYGGWLIPPSVDAAWTCYCVGMGGDVSLEQYLLEKGAVVRSVDPVDRFVREARDAFGASDRFSAHLAAVATFDGTIQMQHHHEEQSSSLTAARLYDATPDAPVEVPAVTLESLRQAEGDSRIDLLKLDIEGLEYDVVPQLDLRALGVRVFCVQVHHNKSVRSARRLVQTIEAQGYRYVGERHVSKLTFLGIGDFDGFEA